MEIIAQPVVFFRRTLSLALVVFCLSQIPVIAPEARAQWSANPFAISETEVDYNQDAELLALSGGGFAAAYQGFMNNYYPYLRVFSKTGAAQTQALNANDLYGTNGFDPRLTGLADRSILVTWQSSYDYCWARKFDSNGAALGERALVYEEQNKSMTSSNYYRPAGLSGGGYVLAWSESLGTAYPNYYYQVHDSNHQVVFGKTQINQSEGRYHPYIKAAGLSDGGFVVSWVVSLAYDTNLIYFRVFHPTGQARTDEVLVTAAAGSDEYDLAADPGGGFVVAYLLSAGFVSHAYGQAFDNNGAQTKAEFALDGTDEYNSVSEPRIAFNSKKQMMVLCRDSSTSLTGRVFGSGLSNPGSPTELAANGNCSLLGLCGLDNSFVAGWRTGGDGFLYGQLFNP